MQIYVIISGLTTCKSSKSFLFGPPNHNEVILTQSDIENLFNKKVIDKNVHAFMEYEHAHKHWSQFKSRCTPEKMLPEEAGILLTIDVDDEITLPTTEREYNDGKFQMYQIEQLDGLHVLKAEYKYHGNEDGREIEFEAAEATTRCILQ